MAPFNLEQFVAHPTWEQFDNCRKDDLLIIANRFQISFSKHLLKRELKAQLVGKLVELRVLDFPAPPPKIAVQDRQNQQFDLFQEIVNISPSEMRSK